MDYLANPFFASVALLNVVAEFHPALDAVVIGGANVEEEQGGRGEQNAQAPSPSYEDSRSLPAAAKVHGVGDGIIAIHAEGDEDVGRRVGNDALHEFDEFAEDEACLPGDGDAPDDVGLHLN